VSDRIEQGPLADLQQQLAAISSDAEKKAQDIKALKAEKQADLVSNLLYFSWGPSTFLLCSTFRRPLGA
jgi:hypothetical protein